MENPEGSNLVDKHFFDYRPDQRIYNLLAKKTQEKNEAIGVREGFWKVIGGRGKKRIVFSKKWLCTLSNEYRIVLHCCYEFDLLFNIRFARWFDQLYDAIPAISRFNLF